MPNCSEINSLNSFLFVFGFCRESMCSVTEIRRLNILYKIIRCIYEFVNCSVRFSTIAVQLFILLFYFMLASICMLSPPLIYPVIFFFITKMWKKKIWQSKEKRYKYWLKKLGHVLCCPQITQCPLFYV